MAKLIERKPAYLTYHHPDGREEQFKINFGNWDFINENSISISANLTKLSRMTKLSPEYFTANVTKEEKVTNSYHINDDKNKAIGSVKQAVETLEKTLLARQLEIERVTLEQDAYVATQVRILDGKLLAAIQEDVLIEELEVAIPAHNGVLAKRVESIFDLTGLDKIAELV